MSGVRASFERVTVVNYVDYVVCPRLVNRAKKEFVADIGILTNTVDDLAHVTIKALDVLLQFSLVFLLIKGFAW